MRSPATSTRTATPTPTTPTPAPVDVPCGTRVACCAARQFVHIEPDESATLATIPQALRFAAPGPPPGHVVLPDDERGRCPMLGPNGCTIDAVRPRTCRAYDYRVFAEGPSRDAQGRSDESSCSALALA